VVAILGDKQLSDLDKEKAMQQHSLAFFRSFFLILLGCTAALGLPFALVWGLGLTGAVSLDHTLEITLSWPFLVGSTVAGIVALVIMSKGIARS